MEMHEIEAWVVVDEAGDYAVAKTQEDACQAFEDDIGWSTSATRQICVKLRVPAPKPVELVGEVPPEPETGTVEVK